MLASLQGRTAAWDRELKQILTPLNGFSHGVLTQQPCDENPRVLLTRLLFVSTVLKGTLYSPACKSVQLISTYETKNEVFVFLSLAYCT